MPPILLNCYKGAGAGESVQTQLASEWNLLDARSYLTSIGFLAPDSDGIAWRFVALQSDNSNPEDAIVQPGAEGVVPLTGVVRNDVLFVTNVRAPKAPDLIGVRTNKFSDRNLSVSVWLNNNDPDTTAANQAAGATSLLMLSKVRPSTSTRATDAMFDNVCVCVDGSVVGFNLTAWGATGFQYYAGPDAGEPIVNGDLNICFGDTPNRFATASIQRYSTRPASIQIRGTAALGIPGAETLRYQKVTFRARSIRSYTQGGRTYTSDERPPALQLIWALNSVGPVPGGSINPGTVTPGPQSGQQFGAPLEALVTDDWTEAVGEVVVYFFVFPDWTIANTVIRGINEGIDIGERLPQLA
ncbi:MAG TPA: hypothetical protein VGF48_26160 [Thermoanaerobaculia bacterium]|jgi:hypothetical protein